MTSLRVGLFAITMASACDWGPQYCEGDWAAAPPEDAPPIVSARTVAQVLPTDSKACASRTRAGWSNSRISCSALVAAPSICSRPCVDERRSGARARWRGHIAPRAALQDMKRLLLGLIFAIPSSAHADPVSERVLLTTGASGCPSGQVGFKRIVMRPDGS